MNLKFLLLLAVLCVFLAILIAWLARHFFSDEAKWERRRRKSNSRVISTAKRPTVKFSVNVPKDGKAKD